MKILLAILLLFPTYAFALEYHGENTIYTDTVWQGEILIDGILTIAQGATLKIRPGTRVRFAFNDSNSDGIGESEIFAQGHFVAQGTAAKPIIFTSAQDNPAPGDWGALNMMVSEEDENLLEHCLVEYGYRGFHSHYSKAKLRSSTFRYNQRGAQFQESTVSISDCTFEHNFNGLQFRDSTVDIQNTRIVNNHWGLRAVFVTLTMRNSQVEANLTNGISLRDSTLRLEESQIVDNRRGIYLQRSQGAMIGNRIENNREHGIYLEDSIATIKHNLIRRNGRSAIKVLEADGLIVDNRIEQSGEFSFYNAGKDDFTVGANWYGESGLKPDLMDGHSREGLGSLLVAPPLLKQPEVGLF
ncbi:MAG: right-handed parallel beta-helix repeat-containing protein [Geopsychrobacter sp.]|nr:right-handed parallel beta-helix repeat-containing protein [Geopsychrobacter sp.]